jgi:antitoxin MazE
MSMLVKARVIKIGNSQGIRIPKLLLEQAGLSGEVEVEAMSGQLIIRPAQSPRVGWDAQFQAMAEAGDDHLLDAESLDLTAWEESEWEW